MKIAARVEKHLAAAASSVTGKIYLAVSGGLDSMVLAEGLRRVCPASRLHLLHVNHSLRGIESDADEHFVKDFASQYGIACTAEKLTWDAEKPSQAACRRKRRDFFSRSARGSSVFLAHHQDDQAETLLLKLLRGTGLAGMHGMREQDSFYQRPLLKFSRENLAACAAAWNLPWREDSSNKNPKYDRNWLRLEIMPLLEKRRPGMAARLAALAEEAKAIAPPAPIQNLFIGDGFCLAKLHDLHAAGPEACARSYRLSRAHGAGLQALLAKPSGRLEAEGIRFFWSCGILLAERRGKLGSSLNSVGRQVQSPLGRWIFSEPVILASEKGEKSKKEFQRAKVPLFFRPLLPRLEGLAFTPAAKGKGYNYLPSPLAEWWRATPS